MRTDEKKIRGVDRKERRIEMVGDSNGWSRMIAQARLDHHYADTRVRVLTHFSFPPHLLLPSPSLPHLARPQHRCQRTLLRTRNRQRIHALNLNPHPRVRAVIARK
jgi:hypothetical protein